MHRKTAYTGIGTRFVDSYKLESGVSLQSANLSIVNKNTGTEYINKTVTPTVSAVGFITNNGSVATVLFNLFNSEMSLLQQNIPYYLYSICVNRSDTRIDFITPAGVVEIGFIP